MGIKKDITNQRFGRLIAISQSGKDKHSIERIDNDGDYSPENCKWALPEEQANNKRNVKKYFLDGTMFTLSQLSQKFSINKSTIIYRLNKGLTLEQSIGRTV